MPPDTPGYYMPYDSGEDTDVEYDEDYDSEDLPDYEDQRIRREEDPRYAIIRAAGPNFNTSAQQLKYMEHAPGSEYNVNTDITTLSTLTYLNPPKTTQTSLFSIKARNRDTNVWPSPFNFQIKTPRVYKNVTKFQLVQLSFPNNNASVLTPALIQQGLLDFLLLAGYNSTCITSCINAMLDTGFQLNSFAVAEKGRVNTNGSQIVTKIEATPGVYSNDALAAELNTQANNTPPLNLISYNTFKTAFQATRDVSLLFNEPGDNFHSKVSAQRHGRHTKDTIMNTYYSQHHINVHPVITDRIAFNTYYYPILKEIVARDIGANFINLDGSGLSSKDDLIHSVLHHFKGLDSAEYYIICSTNRSTLDEFRKSLTFQHRNINNYKWSFDKVRSRFVCVHDSLHTSIKNDINNKLTTFLNQELELAGLTSKSFSTIKSNYSTYNAIFKHLESNLSTVLSNYMLGGEYQYFGGINHSTNSGSYNAINDLHNDATFTALFNYSGVFGNQFGTYAGKNFTFTNFLDYHNTISSYYSFTQSAYSTVSSIHGNSYSQHHLHISSKYSGVLPQEMINTKSYLAGSPTPVAFIGNQPTYTSGVSLGGENTDCVSSCIEFLRNVAFKYYSCLPVNSFINNLSYRLGLFSWPPSFSSLITQFSIVSSQNFNFLMQINNEQSFNNMDIAMTEDYNRSNETTSQVKLMAAKILTGGAGAGEVTETCIQNPILFENPLGKLDKLSFKIYADDVSLTPMWLYFPFEVAINEWDATFQIDEEVAFADRASGWGSQPTVPIPANPGLMPYMALSEPNNPNNK